MLNVQPYFVCAGDRVGFDPPNVDVGLDGKDARDVVLWPTSDKKSDVHRKRGKALPNHRYEFPPTLRSLIISRLMGSFASLSALTICPKDSTIPSC